MFGTGKYDLGEMPKPPPLPKYDPKEEAPMWSFARMEYNLPVERPIKWSEIGEQPESDDHPDWRGVVKNKVRQLPVQDEYSFGPPNDPKYFFFDTPDYADPFKKLWYSFKFFAKTGIILACSRGILEGKHSTLQNNIGLLKKVFAPFIFGTMAGSAAVITVANLRGKKDDYLNYLAGSLVCSSILGQKNAREWVRYTVVCIPIALYLKYNAENNRKLIPSFDIRAIRTSITGFRADRGITSGDFRLGFYGSYGDPGRDQRRTY